MIILKFLKGILLLLIFSWMAGATTLLIISILLSLIDYILNLNIFDSIISFYFSFNFWIMNIILCFLSFIYVFVEFLFTKKSRLYELYINTYLDIFDKNIKL